MLALIKRLKEHNRIYAFLLFGITITISIILVLFRVRHTGKITFIFLIWNIFLALIPYLISTLLVLYQRSLRNRWFLVIPFLMWLCFFPNAPYILTDLFHLKPRPDVPYWYDLALILFFAWNGLMLGYSSLYDIQMVFAERFSKLTGWVMSIISLVLCGFGIYLGRYLRWNSWDVVSSPYELFSDIIHRVLYPAEYYQAYGVTVIFSLFLILGYLSLTQIRSNQNKRLSAHDQLRVNRQHT